MCDTSYLFDYSRVSVASCLSLGGPIVPYVRLLSLVSVMGLIVTFTAKISYGKPVNSK